jgi:hypothetical protein
MEQRFWQVQPASLAAAESDAEEQGGGGGEDDSSARDALELRLAERLLEDEALRGDLTDEEYLPLQDWALDYLHQRAESLADPTTPEAELELEHATGCLRRVLQAASDTIGRRADLDAQGFVDGFAAVGEALEPALYGAEGPANDAQTALQAILPELAARKDTVDGVELVEALVAALRGEEAALGGEESA